ncbi:D-lactate dehydrogenase [Salinicola rhizosphaerae]|uniref:Quinone-dependent D-lactate dehydrogenase n=1 Tax=Salinicola rhizosphaerae TaxID=1443141 RepID=A0ABQ3DZB0_9GAMM|nr:D-lactate dehydrogenase [Salinicola rhizosphaerae]GHB18351.1 D-lactate dehydrogenase [Salinicola rhizosphaerae]
MRHQPASAVDKSAFIERLNAIVGPRHVITSEVGTRRYRKGFRFGDGPVVAVVRPGSLVEQWRVLKACIESDRIVITQAANTGLTGGSTPDGDDYDREIVIVSTLRLNRLQVIDEGRQVICLPGATLDQLEKRLAPLGREPHSVIGSSCLGASVFGGVCNNSGGSLVKRGPAYTELSIHARLDEDGQLRLVNHLGVELDRNGEEDAEAILFRLEHGQYTAADIAHSDAAASDPDYIDHVREIDAETPARFNADPRRLHEAAGSAGKLMVFALRLDTFPQEQGTQVFYLGTNDTRSLTELRRRLLAEAETLPIAAEYMHREAFDIAEQYGKDTFLTIRALGTGRLPRFFALKNRFDGFCDRLKLPANMSDRLLQRLSQCFPSHLPRRLTEYRDRFEHHLMLKVSGESVESTRALLGEHFERHEGGGFEGDGFEGGGFEGECFECTADEGAKAFLHRFAAAGAAVRYRIMHRDTVEDIVALDIALKRSERDWFETLPEDVEKPLVKKLYYGHFLCHVLHQDYIVAKGTDCLALEHRMWELLDARGAEYPAEHNVGHLYQAKPALAGFYRELDPCNAFNPGIGQTSKCRHWGEAAAGAG